MPKKYKLIFMGTPAFAVPSLRALHEAGHDIVAVYTQPPRPAGRGQKEMPSPVQQYAETLGLPVHTPTSLKDAGAQATFAGHGADAAIVTAYGLLLPKPILDACPKGCINVHPSLLPRWRGAAPLQRTIMAGDRETAIVIMQMDEGLDTGAMLLTQKFPIPHGTTAGALQHQLAHAAGPALLQTLETLESITPVPQGETGVTYAKKITKEEAAINWNQPAEMIYHHILGLNPMPGANFIYNGETIKILEANLTSENGNPGTVLDDALTIACSSGSIQPTVILRPGKKVMPAREALRGHPIPKGTQL